MITGTLKANATGYILDVHSLRFDLTDLQVMPNPNKQQDNHPDYEILFRTPRGAMMRVGSMWCAVSARTNNEYFSISMTDKNGKNWRMNAVRNETMPEEQWSVVPMTGGEVQPIMVAGDLEKMDDGNLAGIIEGYDFSMNVVAIPSENKTDPSHPDYHLEAQTKAGKVIRMGSIWNAKSERTGNKYLSIAFWSPHGTQHRANAVLPTDTKKKNRFNVIPLTNSTQIVEDALF